MKTTLTETRIYNEKDSKGAPFEMPLNYTINMENGKVTEVLNQNGWPCRKESEVFEYYSNKFNN